MCEVGQGTGEGGGGGEIGLEAQVAKGACPAGAAMRVGGRRNVVHKGAEGVVARAEEVAFFFDDVLDLPVAERCGLRVLLGHRATHQFQRTTEARGAADVIIPFAGGHHGLREACELLISLWGNWEEVVDHRARFSETYQRYLAERQAVQALVVRKER